MRDTCKFVRAEKSFYEAATIVADVESVRTLIFFSHGHFVWSHNSSVCFASHRVLSPTAAAFQTFSAVSA